MSKIISCGMVKRALVLTIVVILLSLSTAPLVLSVLHFSSFEVNASPAIGSTTVTLYSTADAYVNSSSPETNYGSATSLYVSANSEQDFMYLKFDLTSLPSGANIISAKLMIFLSNTGGAIYGWPADTIGAYYCSDNSWAELGITWSNKPSFNPSPSGSWSFGLIYTVNAYKSWDVAADVETALTSGTLTEVLKFTSKTEDGYAFFQSREGGNKPKLEVEYSTNPVTVVHLESIQDTGATNNLGFITIANNIFSLPADTDVVAGSYQIAYSGGYMFKRWETSGGVTVTDANAATTTVTVSSSGTLRAVGDVTRLEYSYDHEHAGSESQKAGYIDAVRFTPLFSDKLLRARFYIYYVSSYTSNTFKVHVMDENRHDLITPFEQTPTSTGWFDVNLLSYDISVYVGTDFYIGMEWITNYNPNLGEDTSSNFDRSWVWNGTIWQQNTYGDFMIRAVTGLTYNLTISTTAGGSTSPTSGSYVYSAGTSLSIQAIANTGYSFDHWELDGVNTGSANPYTVTINANHTIHAVFKQVNYTLTISTATGGTTNPASGTYTLNSGTSQSVLATASTGYAFDHWMLDGANAGTSNPISVTMNSNHTLQAIFSVSTISLNVVAGTGGTVNPSGTQTLNIGQTYQFNANPNSGYGFDHWDLSGQNRGSSNPLMLSATAAMNGQILTALFTAIPPTTPPPTSPPPPTTTPPPTSPPPTSAPPTSPSPGTQGLSLPREVIYAAVAALVIPIVAVVAVVLKKRQDRTNKALLPPTPPAKAEAPQRLETTTPIPTNHVFISHVVEDAEIASEIAQGLEKAGYKTWYYERDSVGGLSYLLQTMRAIEQSQAVILLISPDSLSSNQVTKEVVRTHEAGKPFIPLLLGISHIEFQQRQPEWREAVGSATSVSIPKQGVSVILPRVINGLASLGVKKSGEFKENPA